VANLADNETQLSQTLIEAFPGFDWSAGSAFYEQIIKPWAVNLTDRDVAVQLTKDNMSLVQVLNSADPDPDHVDKLLSNFLITRREGSTANGFISVYFAGATSVSVSSQTTITCSGVNFAPQKTYIGVVGEILEQSTDEVQYIQATPLGNNEYVFAIEVDSLEATEIILGPGQECTNDLSSNFISSMVTASTFSGGAIPETTAEFIERAKLGVTTSSNTGKDNIRSLVEESPYNVLDSQVFGFGDEVQLRDSHNNAGIATGGRADVYVSTDALIQKVITPLVATRVSGSLWRADIPSDQYAGAYGVNSIRTTEALIDTPIQHELSLYSTSSRPFVDSPIEARYSKYQIMSVLFYDANTLGSSETEKTYSFEILYMPNIDDLQDYIEDDDIEAALSDVLVKAFVPIEISAGITVDYPQGILPPDVNTLQVAVAAAINGRRAGSSMMPASDLVYAVKSLFPEGIVRMPLAMQGKAYLPDGTVGYSSDNDNISVPTGVIGVTPGNTKFFSSPDIVSISLNEVL
jgi:hypothetical protein